jgi:transposase|tara:strand:+ start:393 stop:1940 length:1548 start_codon:yes stop_codon:yes gene_type:complete
VSDQAISLIDKDARIAELEAALAARDTLIETLRLQLAQLKRMSFGQSSEKLITQIGQLELALEELESEAEITGAGEDAAQQPDGVQPVRAAPVRRLPDHLPRIERRIEPETGVCTCPDCGGALRPLGHGSDEMLDVVPVQWRVVRTVRPNYTCRSCEKIVQAPAPAKAIARGKASFATLAHIVVNKFDHHLPLYRQAEMMAAQGIEIDRSTLAGWAGQAAALLDPIVSRIREEGLKASKLHTDDTPVPLLVPGKGKTAQARLWTYVVDDRASGATGPALVWYKFTPDRSGIHPQTELKSFTGLLQADGYAGYEKLYAAGRIREVACWAHFRRKIFENHVGQPTPLTTDLLARIAGLYKIEEEIRGEPPDVRRRCRQERSKPQIDELRVAIDDALHRLSPKSAMAKALVYGRKRWHALTRFLDEGAAEIDNNIAERAMRSVAIGRKNWLFAGSRAGGERAAAIYSVVETCKLNAMEPQAYIADVIEKIASGWPASRWDELMPWNWAAKVAPVSVAA